MADDRSPALIADLTVAGEPVAHSVAVALGAPPEAPMSAVPEVDAYYVDYTDASVLRVYMVSVGRLIRHEYTREGAYLTNLVGLDRVRRVFEEGNASMLQLGIELDADQSAVTLTPAEPTLGPDGAPLGELAGSFRGSFVHAGWVITTIDPDARKRLGAFGADLRLLLAV